MTLNPIKAIVDLWFGRQPLKRALWSYALLYGTLANVAGLLAALVVVANNGPAWLAAGLFFLPLAYVFVAVVGVWRSAGQEGASHSEAYAARVIVVLWAVAMIAI